MTTDAADRKQRQAIAQKKYAATPNGKAVRKRAMQKHFRSDAGKASRRRQELPKRYGITQEQYDKMLALQHGVCAICGGVPQGRVRFLCVDHEHDTKRVRGLVCQFCNRWRIGTNTIETARRVLAYLESSFDGRTL